MATPGELAEQLMKPAETVQLHDDQIKVIAEVLQQMVEKPEPPKRKIDFHAPQEHDALLRAPNGRRDRYRTSQQEKRLNNNSV